jgi:hypothetical protein
MQQAVELRSEGASGHVPIRGHLVSSSVFGDEAKIATRAETQSTKEGLSMGRGWESGWVLDLVLVCSLVRYWCFSGGGQWPVDRSCR